MIKEMSIDLETYSDVDISKCGAYKYAESDNFEILLFGVSIDGGKVQVFDLACGDIIPDDILATLSDDTVTKWAFNANFERICLSNWLKRHHPEHFKGYRIPEDPASKYLDPSSWKCTMVWSAYMGLPLSLEGVGAVLKLQDQKMKEGKDLIKYFCCPCKPTKVNGGRTRNLPEHAPDKWEIFKTYNKRDVDVEMAIKQRLSKFPVPDFVWEEYHLDQEINDRGIMLDMDVVENAIAFDEKSKSELMISMQNITNLDNPNSVVQMKQWLSDHGIEAESLGKKDVAAMIKNTDGDVATALKLRLQLAKSSVKKYQAMQNAVCKDGRAHGMFQFYGANRSGRWAGRLIQLQNLPQNHMNDLADARELVRTGDYDSLELLYDDIPDTLSQLIRTAFIARPGYKFVVSDYSAIEARVLAHLAGESWRSKIFAEGKDIYCASASQMFGVPVEKHGINSHLRQKGKIAELALGYGGSVGALISMWSIIKLLHLSSVIFSATFSHKLSMELFFLCLKTLLELLHFLLHEFRFCLCHCSLFCIRSNNQLPILTADTDVITNLKSHFLKPLTFENDGRCCLVVISALFVNLHASNLLIFHKLVSFFNQMSFFENLT